VYQEVNLPANLSVAETLCLRGAPLRFGLASRRKMNRRAAAMLAQFQLAIAPARLLSSYPSAIRQVVAIARAADLSGKVLILDEPTASLD
jgi:simple sugar transport system ATP-binding protein